MNDENLTMHAQRKLRDPLFNEKKAAYMKLYWLKNREKIRLYNKARFARLKAERLAADQELEDLTNLMKDFTNV